MWILTLLLIELAPSAARANISPAEVLAIGAPRGTQILAVPELGGLTDRTELVRRVLPVVLRPSVLPRPTGEDDLYPLYRTQARVIISRFVKMAIGLMRLNGVELDVGSGTAVRYSVADVEVPGRTTPGIIDACWDCFGAAGMREAIASQLGLDTGPLDGRVSLNPRFARQLVRGSAAIYKFSFRTRERGEVRAGLVIELDESYQPFAADLTVPREIFGRRVVGAAQRIRVDASATLDPFVFGVDRLAWPEVDLFSVISHEADRSVPRLFREVLDRAPADQAQPGFVAQALRDIGQDLRAFGWLSKSRLAVPGSPSWYSFE